MGLYLFLMSSLLVASSLVLLQIDARVVLVESKPKSEEERKMKSAIDAKMEFNEMKDLGPLPNVPIPGIPNVPIPGIPGMPIPGAPSHGIPNVPMPGIPFPPPLPQIPFVPPLHVPGAPPIP